MKFSEIWLREFVNPDIDTQTLTSQLTMAGLEVDEVSLPSTEIKNVFVSEIVSIAEHPDADNLRVCEVFSGTENLQIVCGAKNIRVGMRVVLATVDAELSDRKIKKTKIRGTQSYGMLCSEKELGIGDDQSGVMELPQEAPVGMQISEYLKLEDSIIDVDLTPNRGDCLSIIGLAREVGLMNGLDISIPSAADLNVSAPDTVKVNLFAGEDCPRFVGRVIKDISPRAATPIWMREKLRRSGIRSVDPIVDVTNYVMLEFGQPLHAYDLEKLNGEITVRRSKKGEALTLLDGTEIQTHENSLLIADDSGPIGLAGIMGGQRTAVSKDTNHIFLESAFFSPLSLAGKARSYGLSTDAAYRFERGVDWQGQEQAIRRATELLQEIVGGEVGPIINQSDEVYLPELKKVNLRKKQIRRVLGVSIEDEKVAEIFSRLGFGTTAHEIEEDFVWEVSVPSHRFDINIEVDLIEELSRVFGYDILPSRTPSAYLKMFPANETIISTKRMAGHLVSRGYHEAITYSFVDAEVSRSLDPKIKLVELINPLSKEMSAMRSSIWPGLLKALSHNMNRQRGRVRLFEIGLCFSQKEKSKQLSISNIDQRKRLAFIASGLRDPENWASDGKRMDFYDLKGDVESLLAMSGDQDQFSFVRSASLALNPGQSADILLKGKPVGLFGLLNTDLQKRWGFRQQVFLCEIDLFSFANRKTAKSKEISRFPEIRRDLAFIVDKEVGVSDLLALIRKCSKKWLVELTGFDVYEGKGIDSKRKSVGLGLTFQGASRTLTDSDVDKIIEKVVSAIKTEYRAILRE
ncbi:MAG: phenylalanine--tRNA ligase subunit beta [Gammaproteobacteria bacterium]|nr:phenylalanine--tRNA ligase subunit beta [Gammaproteobacteria bacterium]